MFGVVGFIFAMAALAKIRRLEQRLRDTGILTETSASSEKR